jgi:predicted lipid-binding transport protein (Tim44 family)
VILLLLFGAVRFLRRPEAGTGGGGPGPGSGRSGSDLDFVFGPEAVEAKAAATRQVLEVLARTDPLANPDRLRAVAEGTFRKLQECWQARDYDPMRPLLVPALFAEHTAQLEGMVRNHELNVLADLTVLRVDLVHLRYPEAADQREFTALITARARDHYVDDRDRSFLRGDTAPATFQEFWTFQRQGDAWLLREIEQTRESDFLREPNYVEKPPAQLPPPPDPAAAPPGPGLDPRGAAKVAGVDRLLRGLKGADPLWDPAHLRQVARQTMLHYWLAEQAGYPSAVPAKELAPEVAAALEADIRKRQAEGTTVEYRNLCVRKVEVVLVRNYRASERDEFLARVRAHAQKVVRNKVTGATQEGPLAAFECFALFGRLDGRWKLKEVLPPARGESVAAEGDVNEGAAGTA